MTTSAQEGEPILESDKQLRDLKQVVYPKLNQALEILIDHLIKTNELQQHQEKLKQKRVRDQIEKKRLDKEKMKLELGNEYVSSEEDEESLQADEYDVQHEEEDDRMTPNQDDKMREVDVVNTQEIGENQNKENKDGVRSLPPIEEEEDFQENLDKPEESLSQLNEPPLQPTFNPIEFLGKVLKGLRNGQLPSDLN